MTKKEDLQQRLTEWQEVASAIERGERPYNNLTHELTIKFGKFAIGMIIHLQRQLHKVEHEFSLESDHS